MAGSRPKSGGGGTKIRQKGATNPTTLRDRQPKIPGVQAVRRAGGPDNRSLSGTSITEIGCRPARRQSGSLRETGELSGTSIAEGRPARIPNPYQPGSIATPGGSSRRVAGLVAPSPRISVPPPPRMSHPPARRDPRPASREERTGLCYTGHHRLSRYIALIYKMANSATSHRTGRAGRLRCRLMTGA